MFKHILIPTDGSDLSRKAILYGRAAREGGRSEGDRADGR
jgi:nucleotide-binding universal stress UspA family protein